MKSKLLLYIFLFSPIAAYSQAVGNIDCTPLKSAVDTAYKIFEEEQQNSSLVDTTQEKYDEEKKFTSLGTFFQNGKALINTGCLTSLEQDDIIEKMNKYATELSAGGVYFFNEKDYETALMFFGVYDDFCKSKIATKKNRKNELVLLTEYYAAVASIYTDNRQRTISLLENVIRSSPKKNKSYELKDLYYFLADEYKKTGDKDKFVEAMEKGMNRLPKEKPFFMAFVVNHYMAEGNSQKAIEYVDKLLKKTPKQSESYAAYINMRANLSAHQRDYKLAEDLYKKGLKEHPDNEQLTEGLGVAYALQAQDLKEANNDEVSPEIAQYYKNGAELLEKYRAMLTARNAPDTDHKRVLSYLRNIYYNLGMYKEFDTIDRLYYED